MISILPAGVFVVLFFPVYFFFLNFVRPKWGKFVSWAHLDQIRARRDLIKGKSFWYFSFYSSNVNECVVVMLLLENLIRFRCIGNRAGVSV